MDSNQTLEDNHAIPPFSSTPGVVSLSHHVVAELVGRVRDQSRLIRYAHSCGAFSALPIEEVHAAFGSLISLETLAGEVERWGQHGTGSSQSI